MVEVFRALGCESLLSPPPLVYPQLVRELYANLKLRHGNMVYSVVKEIPIVFRADGLARILDVSDSRPCPFTTHQPFAEIEGLQYED